MSIQVTVLGCGSATPTTFRNPTAQWLEIQGENYLIDCGEGTQIQLLKHKLKMNRLKAVFISHLHGDHFFGLPGLISSMHLMGRKDKLLVYAPEGLFTILDQIFKFSQTELRFELVYIAVNTSESNVIIDSAKFQVITIPLKHRIHCAGFLFKEKPKPRNLRPEQIDFYNVPVPERKKIKLGHDFTTPQGQVVPNRKLTIDPPRAVSYAFCSDTAPDESIIPIIDSVTALYHEATFEDELGSRAEQTFHSTASQAAMQAKLANVEKLFLGHFSSRYRDTSKIEFQASQIFHNAITVFDGFSFEVM